MSPVAVRLALSALLDWSLGVRAWYATPGLDSTRFWDERYPFENVEPIVKNGSLRPANGLHPALTHLPHAVILKTSHFVHQRWGIAAFAVFDAAGHFNSTAYLVCRLLHTVFGTLTILLLFLVGRWMGGDGLGLLAAFLLAAVPYHIHASVKFMADGMLLFTLVLAFFLSLRAVAKPNRWTRLIVVK